MYINKKKLKVNLIFTLLRVKLKVNTQFFFFKLIINFKKFNLFITLAYLICLPIQNKTIVFIYSISI